MDHVLNALYLDVVACSVSTRTASQSGGHVNSCQGFGHVTDCRVTPHDNNNNTVWIRERAAAATRGIVSHRVVIV